MIRTFAHAGRGRPGALRLGAGDQRPDRPPAPLPDPGRPASPSARTSARPATGEKVAWVGDGNNMAHSLAQRRVPAGLRAAPRLPRGVRARRRHPRPRRSERANDRRSRATRARRCEGADVVNTDVWASMGQEEEAEKRIARLRGLHRGRRADGARAARRDLPPLPPRPPRRGGVPTVIDGPQSRVFDEAENRLHVQKAIMVRLMAPDAA